MYKMNNVQVNIIKKKESSIIYQSVILWGGFFCVFLVDKIGWPLSSQYSLYTFFVV